MSGKVDAAVSPPTRKERHDEAGGFGLGQLPREPKSCEGKSVLLMVGTPPPRALWSTSLHSCLRKTHQERPTLCRH